MPPSKPTLFFQESTTFSIIEDILVYFGILLTLCTIIKGSWRYILRPGYNLSKRYGPNTWAVITGSTDGIGKAFAFALAKRGFNIVLISRTQTKLNECAKQIQENYPGVQVETIAKDFKQSHTENFFIEIETTLQSKDISILINNVGLGDVFEFDKIPEKIIKDCLIVNTFSQALLTRLILPKMLARNQKSAIIDLSSFAVHTTLPFLGFYAATKAFNSYLNHALSTELKTKNIDCLTLKPLYVSTTMNFNEKNFGSVTPEQCVEGTLKRLGHQIETNGHWWHCLQAWIYGFMPFGVIGSLIRNPMRKELKKFYEKRGYFENNNPN